MKEQYFTDGRKPKKRIIEQVSIDCVIFGFHQNQLKILLLKFKGIDDWALPGGFVFQGECLGEAASRILEDRTGITNIYLEQFHVFGNKNRQFRAVHEQMMAANGITVEENHWLFQRFISIGFYALVDFSKVIPTPDDLSEISDWYDIADIPKLTFDHSKKHWTHFERTWMSNWLALTYYPKPSQWVNYKAFMRLFWVKN